jgi:hypothetical protein
VLVYHKHVQLVLELSVPTADGEGGVNMLHLPSAHALKSCLSAVFAAVHHRMKCELSGPPWLFRLHLPSGHAPTTCVSVVACACLLMQLEWELSCFLLLVRDR